MCVKRSVWLSIDRNTLILSQTDMPSLRMDCIHRAYQDSTSRSRGCLMIPPKHVNYFPNRNTADLRDCRLSSSATLALAVLSVDMWPRWRKCGNKTLV